MGVTTRIRGELRLARLRERLEDRPNNLRATVQAGEATVIELSSFNCCAMVISGMRQYDFDQQASFSLQLFIVRIIHDNR